MRSCGLVSTPRILESEPTQTLSEDRKRARVTSPQPLARFAHPIVRFAAEQRYSQRNAATRLSLRAYTHGALHHHVKAEEDVITLDVQPQGERFTFFSEPNPGAQRLEFEFVGSPGSPGPDPHIHARQVETFRVIEGEMHAKVGGQERVIRAGESLVVPAGQVHTFRNPSESEPLVIRISVEPALQFQWMMTEYARLAIANGGRWKDVPLLEAAYILHQTRDEHEIPGMPRLLTTVFLGSLAPLAVLLGKHRKISPKPALLNTNGMETG